MVYPRIYRPIHKPVDTDSFLDRSEADLCELLASLIRIDTSNPPGRNYRRCVDFLEQQLVSLGIRTRIHEVPAEILEPTVPGCTEFPRYSLIGRQETGAAKTIHFNAHYDVVPAGPGWRSPPFEPEIREGWFYGRGTNDMKGSIAALLFALKAIRACGLTPAVNVEVAFVPDEETNSSLGTGYLIDRKLVNADYAVICEGGRENLVGCGHNGVLWMEVTVKGKSAHAARPHLGINAFEKAAALCLEFENYKARQSLRSFTAPGGQVFHPPLTLGGETGSDAGSKINTIPNQFSFTIDRRVLPNETMDEVERDLRDFLHACTKKIPDLVLEIRKISSRPSSLVEGDHPLPQAFVTAARRHRPEIDVGITSGFTDMAFYANQAEIPAIGYGVAGRNTHGVDECVSIDDLLTTAKIYASFLTHWKGSDL